MKTTKQKAKYDTFKSNLQSFQSCTYIRETNRQVNCKCDQIHIKTVPDIGARRVMIRKLGLQRTDLTSLPENLMSLFPNLRLVDVSRIDGQCVLAPYNYPSVQVKGKI